MSNRFFPLCIVLGLTSFLSAQPQISYRGILNAASFLPSGLPAGSIARGSIFSIFGTNLGPPASPPLAFPLSTTLGAVSIRVSGNGSSVDAIPLFVGPNQINAIMPSTAPLGPASIVVTFNGRAGGAAPLTVVNSSFGIFTANTTGNGPGIAVNFNSQSDQPINSPTISARPGQTITLWGTGLGPVPYADNIAPQPNNLPTQAEVFVGGKSASIAYKGRSPCCSGDDQVIFVVPSDTPLGCWVPVQVRTEGSIVSNTVTMAITADGSPCSEPVNPYAPSILSGGNIGHVNLSRVVSLYTADTGAPADTTVDMAALSFRQISVGSFPFDAAYSLPPAGSCTVIGGAGNFLAKPLSNPFAKRSLSAGSFTFSGQKGTRTVAAATNPLAQLGKNVPGTNLAVSVFLEPGTINFAGTSGADVGAFQGSITIPQPIAWTNRDQISTVNRSQPLTVTWSGTSGQLVEITGTSVDLPTNSSAKFICVAPATAGTFTVPAAILQSLPPTHTPGTPFMGTLSVGTLGATVPFGASGLDFGLASVLSFRSKGVIYQ